MPVVSIKRVYDPPSKEDGYRVLVDRVWPRGVSKEAAAVDHWAKAIAPSATLRKWFNHDPARWGEFQRRYRAELDNQSDALRELLKAYGNRRITLVFGAKDVLHNQAIVLKDVLSAM